MITLTPADLTHLIYEAADSNVDAAAALLAAVITGVIHHGADQNAPRAQVLLDRVFAKATEQLARMYRGY